jgi:type I restriction enzyme R subunit
MIIDGLANSGVVDPARLYESPFTDVAPLGPDALFSEPDVEELIGILAKVRASAEAA